MVVTAGVACGNSRGSSDVVGDKYGAGNGGGILEGIRGRNDGDSVNKKGERSCALSLIARAES